MIRNISVFLFIIGLAGCATPHLYDGPKRDYSDLAYIIENADEVRIVSIDGVPLKRDALLGRAYLLPGKHKLTARYNWVTYLSPTIAVINSGKGGTDDIKTITVNVKAGKTYEVRSKPSTGPSGWRPYLDRN